MEIAHPSSITPTYTGQMARAVRHTLGHLSWHAKRSLFMVMKIDNRVKVSTYDFFSIKIKEFANSNWFIPNDRIRDNPTKTPCHRRDNSLLRQGRPDPQGGVDFMLR
ncbi:hypothetical protein ElyMa_004965400 [Elysia marginata]|uniref:Uncharacterized protein n=1 Tax=Elysia marginata TaxID=1093978 RepID=A0AAV4J396_9GAST|nr:hypothetical protein ElyMa_004965400 [Elysia marginata]